MAPCHPGRSLCDVIELETLDRLLEALRRRGFLPIGPTVRQGAITYEELDSRGGSARPG